MADSSSTAASTNDTSLSEAYVDFIAGWVSGAVSVLLCQPADTVLTRFQAATTAAARSATASSVGNIQASTRQFMEHYGKTALWRGSTGMISAVPFQNALLMGGYGLGKKWIEKEHEDGGDGGGNNSSSTSSLLPIFVGGCTGGIAQSFLMSPVEFIKVQQQVVHPEFASPTAAIRQVMMATAAAGNNTTTVSVATAGNATTRPRLSPSSLSWTTRGLSATLLRDGIPHGVWFVAYEYSKRVMTDRTGLAASAFVDHEQTSTYDELIVPITSGAFAATVAWAVGYPFDIIKTRIQSTSGSASLSSSPTGGIYKTGIELIQEANGNVIRGLYRGFTLKLIRAVPASMIGFTTYEFVAKRLA